MYIIDVLFGQCLPRLFWTRRDGLKLLSQGISHEFRYFASFLHAPIHCFQHLAFIEMLATNLVKVAFRLFPAKLQENPARKVLAMHSTGFKIAVHFHDKFAKATSRFLRDGDLHNIVLVFQFLIGDRTPPFLRL